MHADEIACCETLEEISLLFSVVQQLGQTLEEKSNGLLHQHHVRELNELLLQVQRKLEVITAESPGRIQDGESPPLRAPTSYRPRAF